MLKSLELNYSFYLNYKPALSSFSKTKKTIYSKNFFFFFLIIFLFFNNNSTFLFFSKKKKKTINPALKAPNRYKKAQLKLISCVYKLQFFVKKFFSNKIKVTFNNFFFIFLIFKKIYFINFFDSSLVLLNSRIIKINVVNEVVTKIQF